MKAVETGRQAEIGAVVHDEHDAWSQARSEFTRFIEHAARVAGFVAILQQRATGGDEVVGRGKQAAAFRKTRRIQDWVQTQQRDHRLVWESSVHGTGSVYRVRGSGRFLYGIIHVDDAPPASCILSAHGRPVSTEALFGVINPEIIGEPQNVAEDAYVVWRRVITQFGSKLEITLAQVTNDRVASPVLAMRSIENDFRIIALCHRFLVSLIEGDLAGPQVPFRLCKYLCRIWRLIGLRGGLRWHRNSPFQIDGHPHLIEQIHTQDPVDLPATRLADGTQINRRELQVAQLVHAQLYLRQRNFAGAGGRTSTPRIDMDLLGFTRRERLQIEDRGGGSVKQKPPVFSRNLHRDNGQAIATFDGNFILLILGLGAG